MANTPKVLMLVWCGVTQMIILKANNIIWLQ